MKLTTRIKLITDDDSHAALSETMRVFNLACNAISLQAFENKFYNKRTLQQSMYAQIRERFDLPAQLVIRAFAKVGDAYKTQFALLSKRLAKYYALPSEKQAKRKKPSLRCCEFREDGCVVYDSRVMRYQSDGSISLRTTVRRIILPAVYHPDFDAATVRGECDLILQDNVFYLLQTIQIEEEPLLDTADFLGVDLGMVHIAVDSEGEFYDTPDIEKKRVQYETRRSALKQRKTKNSRRRLKKMSRKLARFRKDVNHCVSKKLVRKAKALRRGLSLENLENFFDKVKVRKKDRAKRHSWAFYQLRSFVTYKAVRDGIPVVLVEAAYTSQECSECHYIDRRNRKSRSEFVCLRCGHVDNADCNAAKNVRNRASLNRPEVQVADPDREAAGRKSDALSQPGLAKPTLVPAASP
jgi:putative transposase